MIKKVGVVGAGMMGAEIALCFAREGYETVLNDISQEIADRGKEKQAAILDKNIKKGRITKEDKTATLNRVTATGNLEDMADCDLIIEAVLEVFDIKKSVFEKLDAICKMCIRDRRRDKPFIAINCGAIPDNLLESELFGYEKGAFTGAINTGKEGLLEAAAGGTVFLDEIGETPLDFQVKLLRFLESKEIRRVGSNHSKSVDVRVLAATNRNLETMIEEGTFRRDLYYRINVVQIEVPPLRKRKEDIVPLASFFLQKYNQKYGQEKLLTMELVDELEKYQWVGNVRELKNVIENMVIVSNNEYLQTEDLPWDVKDKKMQKRRLIDEISEQDLTLGEAVAELEKQILLRTRETCSSTREMAVKLDVNQSTIVRKMQKYNIG